MSSDEYNTEAGSGRILEGGPARWNEYLAHGR